ncbi:Uncharacterised protein [Peptoniphilus harei]|uniref:Uncharacterized protein n=1 Tax=Peptoniphilus harei TaxID=54005 RepID=A0A2X1WM32_9FIRM|nr:Uncharacterised protein [Peptoniphilus harei]
MNSVFITLLTASLTALSYGLPFLLSDLFIPNTFNILLFLYFKILFLCLCEIFLYDLVAALLSKMLLLLDLHLCFYLMSILLFHGCLSLLLNIYNSMFFLLLHMLGRLLLLLNSLYCQIIYLKG